jgi:hypothetical protein
MLRLKQGVPRIGPVSEEMTMRAMFTLIAAALLFAAGCQKTGDHSDTTPSATPPPAETSPSPTTPPSDQTTPPSDQSQMPPDQTQPPDQSQQQPTNPPSQ